MAPSVLSLPVRATLRTARLTLRLTREITGRGLDVVELLAEAATHTGAAPEAPEPEAFAPPSQRPRAPRPSPAPMPPPSPAPAAAAVEPVHISVEPEVVESLAEPGAEDGAQIAVAEPFPGYDALRAADVAARARGLDAAELGAIKLYESSHRRRRTVLQAVERQARRAR